jgi:hypothetical protein
MSQTTFVAEFRVGGVLTNVTSATLQNGVGGIIRADTGAVVVPNGTAMVHADVGKYSYTFTDPAPGLTYLGYVDFLYSGNVYPYVGTAYGSTPILGSLYDMRQYIVERLGRTDLVGLTGGAPDYSVDNGIDDFLDDAIRWLCDTYEFLAERRYVFTAVAGSFFHTIPRNSLIKRVELCDGAARIQLKPSNIEQLRIDYPEPYGNIDPGQPYYWARNVHIVETDLTPVSDIGDAVAPGNPQLLYLPPADVDYTMQVWGRFYPPRLASIFDTNHITLNHREAVYLAVAYKLAVNNRNSTEQGDWLTAIAAVMKGPRADDLDRQMTELEDGDHLLQFVEY